MTHRLTLLVTAEVGLLLAALVTAAFTSEAADWRPAGLFAVLLALAIASDALAVRHKAQRISGSFLALVLAMALLGPAPAVAIGVTATLLDALRTRLAPAKLLANLATYATFPLIGALMIEEVSGAFAVDSEPRFALVVFAAFMVANLLNFAMIAGDYTLRQRVPFSHELRTIFVPVLPSTLVSALLAVSVAVLYREVGLAALGLFALVLVVFQFLLRALLLSQRRAEELASLQLGMLTSMVETLALRDRMTARHSAAVARYARALAQEHGCPSEEQEMAHRRAAARHRQVRLPGLDPARRAAAHRGRVGDRPPPPGGRRPCGGANGGLRTRRRRDPLPPRALGRGGLPAGPGRRDDPAAVADHLGRRRLRRHDRP